MRLITLFALTIALAACQKRAVSATYSDEATDAKVVAHPVSASSATLGPGVPRLAYDYRYSLEASARRIRVLVAKHTAECASAGPDVCQVTESNLDASGKNELRASLQMRATPQWIEAFRARLTNDAAADGGRLLQADVTSEDLSRQIVDTEATTKARTELRDRLLGVLSSRPAKTSDLVETEKALATVQEELDAANSELAMMQRRVATSGLTVDYQTFDAPGAPTTWSPLRTALHDFVGTVVLGFSTMITVVAWLAPWLLVIGVVLWLLRRSRFWRERPRRGPRAAKR